MFDVQERDHTLVEVDQLKRIKAALAALNAEDREQWTSTALSERVVELVELQERLAAEVLRVVGQWDHTRAWEADGSLSATAWLQHRTPLPIRDARRVVKTARLVDHHDPLATALGDGAVTVGHVDAMARVVNRDRTPLITDHMSTLVDHARSLALRDFAVVMRRWAAYADDTLATDTHEQKWERRHLYASVTLDGWVAGTFLLDPAGGRTLLDRLDTLAPPDPAHRPHGPRSLPQRRADALTHLAATATDERPVAQVPNLNVVVDLPSLIHQTDSLTARRDLDGIGPIPRSVFEQLACDATVTRLVTAGRSVVVDMGRAVRVVTGAQKRALAVRDRHCRFPSCQRTARWCDAHHIVPWTHGGPTNLDNLVLLCRRHHTLIHQTQWTIQRTDNGVTTFTHPTRGP